MEQKIPNISDDDIKRIGKRDFPQLEIIEIEHLLKGYKSKSEAGKNRVYAAILKLSENNIDSIRKYVDKANNDFRDVIALAEYPNYSQYAFDDDLSDKKRRQLIKDDWEQYQIWLNKE